MSTSYYKRLADKQHSCKRCPDIRFDRLARGKSQSHWKYSLENHVKTELLDVDENDWTSLKAELDSVPRKSVKNREHERKATPNVINSSASMSEVNEHTRTYALETHQSTVAGTFVENEDTDVQQDASQPHNPSHAANPARLDTEMLHDYHGSDFETAESTGFPNDPAPPVFDPINADEGSVNMVRFLQAKNAMLEACLSGWQREAEALRTSNMDKDNQIRALYDEIRALQAIRAGLLGVLEARNI